MADADQLLSVHPDVWEQLRSEADTVHRQLVVSFPEKLPAKLKDAVQIGVTASSAGADPPRGAAAAATAPEC